MAAHSADPGADWQRPMDTPLPRTPCAQVPKEAVAEITALIERERFAEQAPFQVGEAAKDGRWEILTVRTSRFSTHEVIYENAESELLSLVRTLARSSDAPA